MSRISYFSQNDSPNIVSRRTHEKHSITAGKELPQNSKNVSRRSPASLKQRLLVIAKELSTLRDFCQQSLRKSKATFARHSFLGISDNNAWNRSTTKSSLDSTGDVGDHRLHSPAIQSFVYGRAQLFPIQYPIPAVVPEHKSLRLLNLETFQQRFEILLPSTGTNKSFICIQDVEFLSSGVQYTCKGTSDVSRCQPDFKQSAFLARMPTWAHGVIFKADPEDLVRRMLPVGLISGGARHIAACFWSFLCAIDDLTESGDCYECIDACVEAFSSGQAFSGLDGNYKNRDSSEQSKLSDCNEIIGAFYASVNGTHLCTVSFAGQENESWRSEFWHEVLTVIRALEAEKSLHGRNFSMNEWLQLRILTISARPFMVLLRASLGLTPALDACPYPHINQIQILVQAALGLQNDILGWEKDHREGNALNAIEVLIRQGKEDKDAFQETLDAHNDIVQSLLGLATFKTGDWESYVKGIVLFCTAMAEWMLNSKRYRMQDVSVPVHDVS